MKYQGFFLKASLSGVFRVLKTLIICTCICAVNPGNTTAEVWLCAPGNCDKAVNPDPATLSTADAGSICCFTSALGFWADPVGWLCAVVQNSGQSFQRSNSASSTILILLIVISILSASLTYFGIILLRIYKKDESQTRKDKLNI